MTPVTHDSLPTSWQARSRPLLPDREPELADRYRRYRRRQARGLVSLLPSDAVRPLYARARRWAKERTVEPGQDPLALLLSYLEDLMPLPPLARWAEDRRRFPGAHLEEEFESAPAHGTSSPPVAVENRAVEMEGERWVASLRLFREHDAWKGFIAFGGPGAGEGLRTTDIFREEDPEEIRGRFRAFHDQTLQAFLRSVLP